MAMSSQSHNAKKLVDWTPADVREWLDRILPNHHCATLFTYTRGYVLSTLTKEDLQRQAKDVEAANVIFAELAELKAIGGHSSAAAGPPRVVTALPPRSAGSASGGFGSAGSCAATALPRERSLPSSAGGPLTVYVRVRQDVVLEIEVRSSDTVATLKERIAERESTPAGSQRLITGGLNMQDHRTLSSYGLRHGATVLLAAHIQEHSKSVPRTFAPRGPLMIPGSKTWQPKAAEGRPYLPVLCSDVSRAFPVSLEFSTAVDAEAFMSSSGRKEDVVLEIKPSKPYQTPVETRLHYDQDTGTVHLESSGHILGPGLECEGFLHYGGRGGHTKVMVATGAAA